MTRGSVACHPKNAAARETTQKGPLKNVSPRAYFRNFTVIMSKIILGWA